MHSPPALPNLLCLRGGTAIFGCAAPENSEPPIELDAKMEIGVTEVTSEGFVAVDDGTDVVLEQGAQGGFHVWTAPRIQGAMGTLYLERSARRVDDDMLVLRASTLVLEAPEDAMDAWWHEEQGIPSFMCPTPIGVQSYDAPINFHFELYTEDEELVAVDDLVLVPRCPEGDSGEFCRDICGG